MEGGDRPGEGRGQGEQRGDGNAEVNLQTLGMCWTRHVGVLSRAGLACGHVRQVVGSVSKLIDMVTGAG